MRMHTVLAVQGSGWGASRRGLKQEAVVKLGDHLRHGVPHCAVCMLQECLIGMSQDEEFKALR